MSYITFLIVCIIHAFETYLIEKLLLLFSFGKEIGLFINHNVFSNLVGTSTFAIGVGGTTPVYLLA